MNNKMDILQELEKIPIKYDSKDGFKKASLKVISDYIGKLKRYGFDSDLIKNVSEFRNYYRSMINCYYKGQHAKAFGKFKTSLKHLNINKWDDNFICKIDEEVLYRARINDPGRNEYNTSEMNHIPFNKRGIVKTERYSFPGLPCLYLGSSAFSCWIEMGRPNYEDFQVARIETVKETIDEVFVLDLCMFPEKYDNNAKSTSVSLNEYLLMWPVLAMCTIQVSNRDDSFKPEYIFPQFLMEYVSSGEFKKKVIGIKYPSTRVASYNQYLSNQYTYTCYVFPTSTSKDVKADDEMLNRYFRVYNTLSGIHLVTLSHSLVQQVLLSEGKYITGDRDDLIYLNEVYALPYNESDFHIIEGLLKAPRVAENIRVIEKSLTCHE